MAKTTKKLALKKETLRRLGTLTDEQLRRAAGGYLMAVIDKNVLYATNLCLPDGTALCAGIRTGGGGPLPTVSCDTHCQTSADCLY